MGFRAWLAGDKAFVIPLVTFWVAAVASIVLLIVALQSSEPPGARGSRAPGWTEVGGDSRLLYRDVDGVRCFRRYYSDELSCVRLGSP